MPHLYRGGGKSYRWWMKSPWDRQEPLGIMQGANEEYGEMIKDSPEYRAMKAKKTVSEGERMFSNNKSCRGGLWD